MLIVTGIAVAVVGTVAAVAVPGGIGGRVDPEASFVPTSLSLPVKTGTVPAAVQFARGWYAAALEDVGDDRTPGTGMAVRTAGETSHIVYVRWTVPTLGVLILSERRDSVPSFDAEYTDSEFDYLLRGRSLTVVDRAGTTHEVEDSIVTAGVQPVMVPVHVTGGIDRLGVLLGSEQRPIGLVSHVESRDVAVLFPRLNEVIGAD